MNIAYLVSDLRAAGPINQAYNLVTGLSLLNCNVWIVTLYEERVDSWITRFEKAKVNIFQLHADPKHLLKAVHNLESFIKKHNVNILHSSGMSADFVNSCVKANVLKINTVRQEFGALAEGKGILKKLFSTYLTLFNHKAMDIRVACSKALQNHLNNYSSLHYECVENGVDVEKYGLIDYRKKNELREDLGIDRNKIVYLSVGVLYTRKQTLALAKTFASCNFDNAILLIVGDGVEMADLKTLAQNNANIILVGKVLDPLQYYHIADIFVSASLAEGLPNTVMEAMACGLPCILSDIGPHKEILDYNNNAGILFKTGNLTELKQVLAESCNWNITEMSVSAHELVNKNLSKYCTANKYYDLYKRSVNE